MQVEHKPVSKQSSYSPVDTKLIKILLAGDRCTGKSSLMKQTTATGFSCHYNTTVSFLIAIAIAIIMPRIHNSLHILWAFDYTSSIVPVSTCYFSSSSSSGTPKFYSSSSGAVSSRISYTGPFLVSSRTITFRNVTSFLENYLKY